MSANCEREEEKKEKEKASSSHLAPVKQQQQWNRFISHCTHTHICMEIDSSSVWWQQQQQQQLPVLRNRWLSFALLLLTSQASAHRQTGRQTHSNQSANYSTTTTNSAAMHTMSNENTTCVWTHCGNVFHSISSSSSHASTDFRSACVVPTLNNLWGALVTLFGADHFSGLDSRGFINCSRVSKSEGTDCR